MTAAANAGPVSDATPWHAIAADEVVRRLESNTGSGLDAAEAKRRLERYGPNRLPEAAKQGPLMRLLLQFNNVLVYVLLGAGFIKAMMGLWLDASVILGVVILNALLGFVQEGRAEKALDSIRSMLSAEARTAARRGDPHDPGGGAGAGRRRASRIGRPDPCRPAPRRREEPAN